VGLGKIDPEDVATGTTQLGMDVVENRQKLKRKTGEEKGR